MAKANPVTGTTYYLPEGAPVPAELPDGVRLVGPGAPEDAGQPGQPASSEPEPEPEPAAEPGDEYDTWTNDDLREELQERGLATSGNKPDLVKRLREDDRAERP